jgi:diaminobutyrate-2-oxoglutarate transaminase
LDLATEAKAGFLSALRDQVLAPRGLDYRVQFTSPSGTNAVEAALKLARLVTGRTNVVAFSGGFHGVSTGALAATAGPSYKAGLWATLPTVTHVPFPVSPLGPFDSLGLLDRLVDDPSAGMERPAAVLVETVQGEGGVWVAPVEFLRGLRAWCDRHKVVLIVDDVQAGCGRTGAFFSFERAGIAPDLVVLSKSIGGYGLPMAVLLIRPELDIWAPGQHNGTFRGNQLAFVAGAAAIEAFWVGARGAAFTAELAAKAAIIEGHLAGLAGTFGVTPRGLGLMWGIDLTGTGIDAGKVSRACFERHMIVEVCGRGDTVLKLLPPLTITPANLTHGLHTITDALTETAGSALDGVPACREA